MFERGGYANSTEAPQMQSRSAGDENSDSAGTAWQKWASIIEPTTAEKADWPMLEQK